MIMYSIRPELNDCDHKLITEVFTKKCLHFFRAGDVAPCWPFDKRQALPVEALLLRYERQVLNATMLERQPGI